MSVEDLSNEDLLERVSEAIQLASEYMEEFTSTYVEKDLQKAVDTLSEAINDNNLEDAYAIHLPWLQKKLDDCAEVLAQQSHEHFFTEYGDIF